MLERSTATLHCIVRPDRRLTARARLRSHLLAHGVDAACFDGRVRAVEADLSHTHLGCSQRRLDGRQEVDAICHAGAAVNWVFHPSLRNTNVAGTLELLRLACRRVAIPSLRLEPLCRVFDYRPA